MAEIFGAVASGAGLASLAMQLLESAHKLHSLYDSCKNAPDTIQELSFELETMSLSLRHLERHRVEDSIESELLARCMSVCQTKTARITALVSRMDSRVQSFCGLGKLYAAFKEPEMDRMLDGLERAKSAISLAYMTYCQSWNLRESTARLRDTHELGSVLASHGKQLDAIHAMFDTGAVVTSGPSDKPTPGTVQSLLTDRNVQRGRQRTQLRWRVRVALPTWMSRRLWEVSMYESAGLRRFDLRSVRTQIFPSPLCEYFLDGKTMLIRKLLETGHLSTSDDFDGSTLLKIAVRYGGPEIVNLILSYCVHSCSEGELDDAVYQLLRWAPSYEHRVHTQVLRLFDNLICIDADHPCRMPQIFGPYMMTENCADFVLRNQVSAVTGWRLEDRFKIMSDVGWYYQTFQQRVRGTATDAEIAAWTSPAGCNALHAASESHADCLSELSESDHARTEFLAFLLRIGTNPHALNDEQRTPFQVLLGVRFAERAHWVTEVREDLLRTRLQMWANAIRKAGLSLIQWTEEENAVWSRTPRMDKKHETWRTTSFLVHRLLYSSSNDVLDLEVAVHTRVSIYERRHPPGTFPIGQPSMPFICWDPGREPDAELWIYRRSVIVVSEPITLLESGYQNGNTGSLTLEEQVAQYSAAQDDNGPVYRTLREHAQSPVSTRHDRAMSAPAPSSRTVEAPPRHEIDGMFLDWLPPTGYCAVCKKLCFKNASFRSEPDPKDLLKCLDGHRLDFERVRKSRYWQLWSWEAWLMRDAANVEVASRFADRFWSGGRNIVEETAGALEMRKELRAILGDDA